MEPTDRQSQSKPKTVNINPESDQNELTNNNKNRVNRKRNQKIKHLKVMYSNTDSMLNKRDEILAHVNNKKPHVIVITEVNSKNQKQPTCKQELELEAYSLFTNANTCRTRGVAVYVRTFLSPTVASSALTEAEEIVPVEINLAGRDKLLVAGIYRSPSGSTENNVKINEWIKQINVQRYSHILLMGDFNYPDIKWENG